MADAAVPIRVIVHAGFHKTGTTSIQSALAANRAVLEPAFRVEVLQGNPALREITRTARDFSQNRDPVELALFQGLLAAWLVELPLAPGQGLLLSCEDLAGHMPGDKGLVGYDAAAPLAGAMARVFSGAFAGGLDLRFLYTTREADAWLRSLYWQLSKHPHLQIDREAFLRDFVQAADFKLICDGIAQEVAPWPVCIAALEDSRDGPPGPVGPLLDLAGLAPQIRAKLVPAPSQNAAPAYDLAPAFVALNRAGLPPDLLRRMKEELRAMARDPGADD